MHTHTNHCNHIRHNHQHGEVRKRGYKLLWATFLNFSITIVQIVGGILSNSLSLISDAIHNMGDASAIFIAFLAGKQADKQANERKTFGYKRVEILAALFNAIVLVAICLFLFVEAFKRFANPEPIKGKLMLIIAVFGLLANLISVIILHKDKSHNLNVKAAYLHLLGDTLSSIAVIIGGIAIWMWNIYWIDPLITVLVGGYIIWHTVSVVRKTVNILMQATPENIDIKHIKRQIETIPEIKDIHHLHLWQLHENQIHLEAHINTSENINMEQLMQIRKKVETILAEHNINHTTLQFGYNCCSGNNELIVNENM